jgi:hypothetical protein
MEFSMYKTYFDDAISLTKSWSHSEITGVGIFNGYSTERRNVIFISKEVCKIGELEYKMNVKQSSVNENDYRIELY